jgi:hypothetical protein
MGVVFLMVGKPDLTVSVIIVALSFVLGLASAVPAWSRNRAGGRLARSRAQ